MALSPNYGFPEPDNSSLVKNGAQDIRALGDAVDTAVWNVGFGQAAKNKIINGDFGVNQRAFTTSTADGSFCFDRYKQLAVGDGTSTFSAQVFTPGAAPIAGYEASNFLRIVTTGQTTSASRTVVTNLIENVRTFAGQTVTFSFFAKASTGTPNVAVDFSQLFGTGGSATITGIGTNKLGITSSWARYSVTMSIPSISGKTIGAGSSLNVNFWVSAGSDFNARTNSLGLQSVTIDTWGWQLEYGSKATPFQLAGGGDPQSELALCQRYYYRTTAGNLYSPFAPGCANGATSGRYVFPFAVTMRVKPTALEYSTLAIAIPGSAVYAVSSLTLEDATNNAVNLLTANSNSGLSNGAFTVLLSNNSTSGYIGVSSEL